MKNTPTYIQIQDKIINIIYIVRDTKQKQFASLPLQHNLKLKQNKKETEVILQKQPLCTFVNNKLLNNI